MLDWPCRAQHLAARALRDVVLGIVAEAAQRHRAPDRLCLGRDERVDAASLEPAIDLAIGIAGIGGGGRDRHAGRGMRSIDAL